MYNTYQATTEYEYVLHALDKGISVLEIKEELSRWERERTISGTYNTLAERGAAYENQL